jgi:hypothetical protein
LQAATYSNYAQARRAFADQTMRPLWRNAAGSLARIITVPPASELWYDDRDIPALRRTRRTPRTFSDPGGHDRELINAGYEPDSVVKAVTPVIDNLLTHRPGVGAASRAGRSGQPPSVNGNGQPQLPAPTP